MVVLSELNALPAPTKAFLDELASLLRNKPEGRGWICPFCSFSNNPVDNLLVKFPPFKCSNPDNDCHGKCPATPDWSIDICIINKVRTDFVIRNQGPYPTCTAHALLHGMDAQLHVKGALRGKIVGQPLNDSDLLRKYHETVGLPLGEEEGEATKERTPRLLQIAQAHGVEYSAPPGSLPTGRVVRLESWFYVKTAGNINFLVRLIASGFPLLTGMTTGRCLKMANNGELYLAPKLPLNHAVALIGCCVKPCWLPAENGSSTRREDVLFKARNSKGDQGHKSGQHVATGGDIYLLAEDLSEYVFGFHVEVPAWMQSKEFASGS